MIRTFRSKFNILSQNDFVKSVTTLATGTVISQILPLLVSPLIARLYLPTDYAILAAYTAVTSLLTIVSTGMFDSALMLDKEDEDAVNTGAIAIIITTSLTFLSFVGLVVFSGNMASFMGNNALSSWLYFAPLTVFFYGSYQTLNIWNNRKGRYKRLATNKIIMTATTTSITIILGFSGFHREGLIISMIAGQILSFTILLFQTLKTDGSMLNSISILKVKQSFQKHKDFPRYNMPQGFLDVLKDSTLVWVISFYFGSIALGSFSFAKTILMRPLQIINSAVSQVFYQRASKIFNETSDLKNISRRTFLALVYIGLPFAILVFFLGDVIFKFVFGAEWEQAGGYSQILIFWLLISFVASPLGNVPIIYKKQKIFFLWSIVNSVIPIIMILLTGLMHGTVHQAIFAYSVSNFIIMLLILLWIRNILINNNLIKIKSRI